MWKICIKRNDEIFKMEYALDIRVLSEDGLFYSNNDRTFGIIIIGINITIIVYKAYVSTPNKLIPFYFHLLLFSFQFRGNEK